MPKYHSKAIFFIIIAVLLSSSLFSQQIIKEAGIRFNLNDTLWKRNTSQNDNTNNATVYRYKRIPIETSDGRQVIPNITVVVETVQDSLNVMVFSAMKRVKTPFDVEEVFTSEKGLLQYQNAIGYRGGYTDKTGIRHTILIIYLINKNKGVQMVMDITRELYDDYKGEFEDVIRSIEAL
jgi:hypothetical protein